MRWGGAVISKQWRERLIYAAMSVFLVFHTIAMVVAPGPDDGRMLKSMRALVQPYLALFRLDSQWDFFAPNVSGNSVFRYVVKDASGVGHTFVPSTKWSWFHPSSIWFHDWYDTVTEEPALYADAFGRSLCREHAALNPVSVVLQTIAEQEFRPEDLLNGKHPLDPEFVDVKQVKNVKCSGQ